MNDTQWIVLLEGLTWAVIFFLSSLIFWRPYK